ncbi:hypothetical protein ACFSHQ_13115 [Gemmobacter lanyuensis]
MGGLQDDLLEGGAGADRHRGARGPMSSSFAGRMVPMSWGLHAGRSACPRAGILGGTSDCGRAA